MKRLVFAVVSGLLLYSANVSAQIIRLDTNRLEPVQVSMSARRLMGKQVIRVVKDSTVKAVDQPTFVKLKGVDFRDGTIEITVLSRLLPNAPELARGFIGVAFRINNHHSAFECLYIRPTNGRADNQLRRNRSTQYFSFPDHSFERFRKEAPGEYESYADMGLNEWIKLKIDVKGNRAKLFVDTDKQPVLIVNDLKLGDKASGAIGLWVDVGTEGFFTDMKIHPN